MLLIFKPVGTKAVEFYNQKQQLIYAAKTGIVVDIQNIGKNDKTIAVKSKISLEEIQDDVWLSTDVIEFADGNFTNVYNLFWNSKNPLLKPSVYTEQKPYYLLDTIEKDPSILAIINGSFFFLIDVEDKEPKEYAYNFCMRENKVFGLPSIDCPIIYTLDDQLHAKEIKANGYININGKAIHWVGNQSKNIHNTISSAILYNSASSKLKKYFDPKTGVRVGVLDNNRIHTPKNKDIVDLIINKDKKGRLIVKKIKKGGGSHFFEGLFILQIAENKNNFRIGDKVKPLTLDGLDLTSTTSGITVNKRVHDPYFFTKERINSRDARSVIAQDVAGNIHFVVFDGSKYIPKFKGVSSNDIASYFSPDKYNWAYYLDGGSSSRIIVRENNDFRFLANEFAFKKITNEIFLWDWKRHRKLASSIALKINRRYS